MTDQHASSNYCQNVPSKIVYPYETKDRYKLFLPALL